MADETRRNPDMCHCGHHYHDHLPRYTPTLSPCRVRGCQCIEFGLLKGCLWRVDVDGHHTWITADEDGQPDLERLAEIFRMMSFRPGTEITLTLEES